MSKPRGGKDHSSGRTLSGVLAAILSIIVKRLVYTSALHSRGALKKMLILPVLVILARTLRLWSRSYLGQRLGIGWSRQTYVAGHDHRFSGADIGDEWQQFQHGNVVISPLPKRKTGSR